MGASDKGLKSWLATFNTQTLRLMAVVELHCNRDPVIAFEAKTITQVLVSGAAS